MGRFERSLPLLGEAGLARLRRAHVLLLGLGGVGSYTAEALVRAGLGELTLADGDVFQASNLNRQLGALTSTLGQKKTAVTAARLRDIDPDLTLHTIEHRLMPDEADTLLDTAYDYVIDAIDDIPVKIAVAIACHNRRVPLLACLGTGNKWDPTRLEVTDLFATHTDPLAKRMRKALKDAGVHALEVVFSSEVPLKPRNETNAYVPPASLPFVPPSAGILLAQVCVQRLLTPLQGA